MKNDMKTRRVKTEKRIEKNEFRSIPFWSWNGKLDKTELIRQIEWMKDCGIGGFFMHARGGLHTKYMGKEWFDCVMLAPKKQKNSE